MRRLESVPTTTWRLDSGSVERSKRTGSPSARLPSVKGHTHTVPPRRVYSAMSVALLCVQCTRVMKDRSSRPLHWSSSTLRGVFPWAA
jgi:hypothetical protein